MPAGRPASARAVGSIERALLVFRWVALASMVVNFVLDHDLTVGNNPALGASALVVVGAWNVFLTKRGMPIRGRVLAADFAVCAALFLISGMVMPDRLVGTGPSLLALTYPFATVLTAGSAYGPIAGGIAGILMGTCSILVRDINGIPLTAVVLQRSWPPAVGYVLLGLLFGIVSNLLQRSADEVNRATAEAIALREREARLAERESMAREIHDSVLQVLALIHKRGKQLAETDSPSSAQVMELAEMARDQEAALRGLIMREPEKGPLGEASLRTALEVAARNVRELNVSVSSVGPVWLSGETLEELVAAVKEALANVVEHARATKAAIFADEQDGLVQVTVRDDGVGFEFDEARFRAEGKFGVLNSMRGRIEALGGQMKVESRPGAGTEIEFQVPSGSQVAQ
jgi:signal transduction histidine kinase